MRALITGGTSGIGYGVARQLAERGWDVTIVGRSVERGTQIASDLGGTFIRADLSLMSEVSRLAEQIEDPIDALVMCAGGVSTRSEATVTLEGFETTFACNYLSKFALSQMLLSQIKPGGCMLMVGGNGKTKNVSTEWATHHPSYKAAYKAALAVDIYASLLASRTTHVRIHTCYPGMVRTDLLKDASAPIRLLTKLLSAPIEQGSSYLTRLILEQRPAVQWKQNTPLHFAPPLPVGQHADNLWAYSQQTIAPYLGRRDEYAL
jgi:NAD(P)-dependent dehydrogenase (short-subunit alcohol dehydrogenase family)